MDTGTTENFKPAAVAALLIAASVAVQLGIALVAPEPHYDEAIQYNIAHSIAESGLPERANASGDRFFIDGPSAGAYLIALPHLAGLGTLMACRAVGTAASVLILFFIYKTAKLIGGGWAGTLAVASIALNPFFLLYAHSLYLEVFLALFLAGTAYFLVAYLSERGSPRRLYIAGALLGLALLTKYHAVPIAVVFGIVALVVAARDRTNRMHWLGAIAVAAAISLVWPLFASLAVGWDKFSDSVSYRINVEKYLFHPAVRGPVTIGRADFLRAIANWWGELTAVVFVAGVAIALARSVLRWRSLDGRTVVLLLLVMTYLGSLLLASQKIPRYSYGMLPALAVLAGVGFAPLLAGVATRLPRPGIMMAGVLFLVLAFSSGIPLPVVDAASSHLLETRLRESSLRRAIMEAGEWVRDNVADGQDIAVTGNGPIFAMYSGHRYSQTMFMGSCPRALRILHDASVFVTEKTWRSAFPRCRTEEAQKEIEEYVADNFRVLATFGSDKKVVIYGRIIPQPTITAIEPGPAGTRLAFTVHPAAIDHEVALLLYESAGCTGRVSQVATARARAGWIADPEPRTAGYYRLQVLDTPTGESSEPSQCAEVDVSADGRPPIPLLVEVEPDPETVQVGLAYGGRPDDTILLRRYLSENCEASVDRNIEVPAAGRMIADDAPDREHVTYYRLFAFRPGGRPQWSDGSRCVQVDLRPSPIITAIVATPERVDFSFNYDGEPDDVILLRRHRSLSCRAWIETKREVPAGAGMVTDDEPVVVGTRWYQLYSRRASFQSYAKFSACVAVAVSAETPPPAPRIGSLVRMGAKVNVSAIYGGPVTDELILRRYSDSNCSLNGELVVRGAPGVRVFVDSSPVPGERRYYGLEAVRPGTQEGAPSSNCVAFE